MTKIWDTITDEFFKGRKGNPTKEENDLIEYFISRPKFKDLLNKLVKEELIQKPEPNYSNQTQVSVAYLLKTVNTELLVSILSI